jgi:hypothetical protein
MNWRNSMVGHQDITEPAKARLAPRKKRRREVVSSLQHLHCQWRYENQRSMPDASVCQGSIREHSYRRKGTLSSERPRKPIPRDCNGLFHQVAGGLHRSQPGGVDGGGSPGYQLLPLQVREHNFKSRLEQCLGSVYCDLFKAF